MIAGSLTVELNANIARLAGEINSAKGMFSSLESSVASAKSVLASLGAGLSVTALAAFVKSGINAADEINKLSQKLGVSVESLSAFRYAAKLADVSAEEMAVGLRQLAKNAQDAQAGTGDAAAAFAALKIEVAGAGGQLRGTEDLLLAVAERFSRIEDGAGKTALAMKIFGRSGAELIPLLNQGRAGFEELRKEAERLGIIISKETARAAEQFNDDLTRLASASDKLKFALTERALPALTRTASAMAEAAREGEGLWGVMTKLTALSPATDLFKAEREMVQLADELLSTQNELDRKRRRATPDEIVALEEHIARIKTRFDVVRQLRGVLAGETDIFGAPKAPVVPVGKEVAPALFKTDKNAELLGKQLQEGMDEEVRIAAETAQIMDDFRVREREAEQAHVDERNRILIEGYDRDQEAAIAAGAEELAIQKAIADQKKAQRAAEFQGQITFLGNMASLMQSHNRATFEAGKVFAIGQALVRGYLAVQEAYEDGMRTGGFWVAAAYAAAAAVYTGMQVIAIKNATMGGGAAPVYSAVPGTSVPSEQTGGAPPTLPQAAAPRARIDVTVTGALTTPVTYQQIIEEFIPALNEALANGADLNVTLV